MNQSLLRKAWSTVCLARATSQLLSENRSTASAYVHATAHGHEVAQSALGFQIRSVDYVYPYYRDDALFIALGLKQEDLFAQLLAKGSDPFSMGRSYYAHVSTNNDELPFIPHQSSGTGMQAIPAVGAALGLQYRERQSLEPGAGDVSPVVVCSIGDGALSEGEVSEAIQFADLKSLPILFFVQDNQWCLSAKANEVRGSSIEDLLSGYRNLRYTHIDGTDFVESHTRIEQVISSIREERRPAVIHASVPLLGHHTSAIQSHRYRDDLEEVGASDPLIKLRDSLARSGMDPSEMEECIKVYQEMVYILKNIGYNLYVPCI